MATTWAMATKMRVTGVKEGEGDGGNSDGDGDEGTRRQQRGRGCEVSPSPPTIPFVRPSRLHPLHYRANRDADTSLNGQIGASIKMTK